MIHKISIAGILAIIAYIVYTSLYKGYILWPFLIVMAVLAAVYYATTALVTTGMVGKALGCKPDFILRAGYIEKNGKDLTGGMFVISNGRVLFFSRKGDLGGCRTVFDGRVDDIGSYSIGKVDDYHTGLLLEMKGKQGSHRFTGRKFPAVENDFRKALGWGAGTDD